MCEQQERENVFSPDVSAPDDDARLALGTHVTGDSHLTAGVAVTTVTSCSGGHNLETK